MKQKTKKIFNFYWKHILVEKKLLFMLLFIGVAAALDMYTPILFKNFINILSDSTSISVARPQLMHVLQVMLGVSMLRWGLWRLADFQSIKCFTNIMNSVLEDCFTYIQGHSVDFFNNTYIGSVIKKINRSPRVFDVIATKIMWDFWPMLIKLSIVLVVLTYLNVWLGITMLVWTIGFIGLNWFLAMYKSQFDVIKAEAETASSGALADSLTNHKNIKLFAAFKFELARYKIRLKAWQKATMKTWNLEAIINAAQSMLMIILEILILYIAILMWEEGRLTVGAFVLIQTYVLSIFQQLWNFGNHMRAIYERLADADEIVQILNQPHSVQDCSNAAKLKVSQGTVAFQRVTFSYTQKGSPLIKNLTFKIKPGEKVAFIGPSGGGKSTILKLVLRLFNLNGGKILIDGQDISKVTQDSLRQHIAMVPQDPILFHRSLFENIAYGHKSASKAEVIAAAKLAKCHQFIMDMPKQYDTLVGERGIKLSGGQRQRVAIARAILSNATILILDEATSSLDSESETLIQKALDNLMRNKTTIIVAHRLSTIMKADRILVLKQGKIVEEGSHADLLDEHNSLYKKLWDLQVGGYLEEND